MDQGQFKVRMSVGTKLLLVITFLLATPIFVLNLSAITLFRNDKKAYVYDSQATAAVLAGREFVSYLDNALGTLKLIIGSVDVSRPLTDQARKNIQFYLENQHALVGAELFTVLPGGAQQSLAYRQVIQAEAKALELEPDSIRIELSAFERRFRDLGERGYFFENITKTGQAPMLAIVVADKSRVTSQNSLSVAVGYAGLRHFLAGSSRSFNSFLIADRNGELLFHSEITKLYTRRNLSENPIFRDAWNSSVISGAQEFVSPEGARTLGSFYRPGLDLVALSLIDYDKAMQATYTLTEKFIVLGLAALGIMIVLGLIFSKQLTAPLNRLFKATAEVSSGNFNVHLPVTSRDEIGALTNSFLAMSRKISDLLQSMVDKVRVDQELEIAKTVQTSLFPPASIRNEHLNILSHYQSATECGGDWWGYFRTGHLHTFVIADATGHGLPSALMTASARSCFSVIEALASERRFALNPAEMLSIANRVVFDSAQGKIMMTCMICVLDFNARVITYASAAHNPPWLFSPASGGGAYRVSSLIANGQRLGESRTIDAPYEIKQAPLARGDTLVLYTDGLLEGKNTRGLQYGKKQARLVIEDAMAHEPEKIISTLMSDFLAHNAGKPLDDDVTLAVARVLS